MPSTYLSTHPGDVERWAARRDAVPVREGDEFALVHGGEAELDQERLHWDEFFAEGRDQAVVLREDAEGGASLSVVDRFVLLDRLDLPPTEREAIEDHLENGETIELPVDDTSLDAADVGTDATSEAPPTAEPEDTRTEPEERDVGKIVVAATGGELGVVTAVSDDEVFVDPHAGLAESAMATLGWSDVDEEDHPVDVARIEAITPDAVRLTDVADGEEFRGTVADR